MRRQDPWLFLQLMVKKLSFTLTISKLATRLPVGKFVINIVHKFTYVAFAKVAFAGCGSHGLAAYFTYHCAEKSWSRLWWVADFIAYLWLPQLTVQLVVFFAETFDKLLELILKITVAKLETSLTILATLLAQLRQLSPLMERLCFSLHFVMIFLSSPLIMIKSYPNLNHCQTFLKKQGCD